MFSPKHFSYQASKNLQAPECYCRNTPKYTECTGFHSFFEFNNKVCLGKLPMMKKFSHLNSQKVKRFRSTKSLVPNSKLLSWLVTGCEENQFLSSHNSTDQLNY